jgi:hypothetical protein
VRAPATEGPVRQTVVLVARRDGLVRDVFALNAIDELYLDIAKRSLQGYGIATVCPRWQADNKYFPKLKMRFVFIIPTTRNKGVFTLTPSVLFLISRIKPLVEAQRS